jgi:hypothetical protein
MGDDAKNDKLAAQESLPLQAGSMGHGGGRGQHIWDCGLRDCAKTGHTSVGGGALSGGTLAQVASVGSGSLGMCSSSVLLYGRDDPATVEVAYGSGRPIR